MIISAVNCDVANTRTPVSGSRDDVVGSRTTVSDSYRKALKNSEDTRGQDRKVGTISTLRVTELTTWNYLDSCHVSNLDRKLNWYLTFASSAPGESQPPLPRSIDGTVSDIRRDVMKARAIVSGLECDVTSAHTMVSDIHRTVVKGREGSGGKNLLVGDTRTLAPTE